MNRSAQSLTRSKSQDGKSRRAKDKEQKSADKPLGQHADTRTASRLPLSSASQTMYASPSYTNHATKVPVPTSSPPRSPTRSPHSPHSRPNRSTPTPNNFSRVPQASSSAYSPRAQATRPSSPTSPTSRRDAGNSLSNSRLLLNRPVARPITPSNSNSSSGSRRVLGILLPSTNSRKAASSDTEGRTKRGQHHPRSGSGSSHEPLLPTVSRTSTNDHDHRHLPRAGTSKALASPPRAVPARITPRDASRSPVPSPTTPSRSQRLPTYRDEVPPDPSNITRKSTPKLDFWRSVTPRAGTADQNVKALDKGKQKAVSPVGNSTAGRIQEMSVLHSPQARAPVTFLPQIPKLQRTPPTPQKGERAQPESIRVDSFMSDSMPLPLPVDTDRLNPPEEDTTPLSRHPAFAKPTPPPERPPAPGLNIQRSKSAPGGSRGRASPCLRIPSPKFLSKDKDEKMREKRKVTPESVGSPIIRETRLPEKPASPKFNVRRVMLPTFDFERPGSRGSSKSGHSEPKGSRNDDEKGNEKCMERQPQHHVDHLHTRHFDEKKERERERKEVVVNKTTSAKAKPKAPIPVPPLPTSRRNNQSPLPLPPRTRSPKATTPTTAHSQSTQGEYDDSALPRLSSSLAKRSNSRSHRTQASHPSFSFEPASSASSQVRENGYIRSRTNSGSKPTSVRVSDQYIDTQTGLVWAPTKLKDNAIPEEGREVHYYSLAPTARNREHVSPPRAPVSRTPVSPRELEEATEVIAQFKSALNETGFASLQKCEFHFSCRLLMS